MSRRRSAATDLEAAAGASLRIVQLGSPVLRLPSRELTDEEIGTPEIRRLVELMRLTMHVAPGVGLAAPQIGLGIRLAVIEDPPEFVKEADEDEEVEGMERTVLPFTVLINPSYQTVGDERRQFFEGCLSMPGYRALVSRHRRVRARWQDLEGRHHNRLFSGWPARIVQHEIDHLDGTVYVDRMDPRSLVCSEAYDEVWADLPLNQVRDALGLSAD